MHTVIVLQKEPILNTRIWKYKNDTQQYKNVPL